jgi:hypothetical protein
MDGIFAMEVTLFYLMEIDFILASSLWRPNGVDLIENI